MTIGKEDFTKATKTISIYQIQISTSNMKKQYEFKNSVKNL